MRARQVQAYSAGLAGQSEALKGISQLQSQVTAQLRDTSASLQASTDQYGMVNSYFAEWRTMKDPGSRRGPADVRVRAQRRQ
jgi:hypothetical protein